VQRAMPLLPSKPRFAPHYRSGERSQPDKKIMTKEGKKK
jgi:hypothetical protein